MTKRVIGGFQKMTKNKKKSYTTNADYQQVGKKKRREWDRGSRDDRYQDDADKKEGWDG